MGGTHQIRQNEIGYTIQVSGISDEHFSLLFTNNSTDYIFHTINPLQSILPNYQRLLF